MLCDVTESICYLYFINRVSPGDVLEVKLRLAVSFSRDQPARNRRLDLHSDVHSFNKFFYAGIE